jgi:hypothetical protein
VGVGAHGGPIYRNPLFQKMNFGRTGCPISCPFHGQEVDYTQVVCPEAERVSATQSLSIGHAAFLGEREDMDLILEAFRKVRANVGELRER